MKIFERVDVFANMYGFEVVDKNVLNKICIDESKEGIAACPCIFKPSGDNRLSVLIENRCPCKELISLKQGESCTCGLFRKK
jgi:ferredoxin-thioredoxin reductase catalytic subunit